MSQPAEKIKYNRKPLIIYLCITAVMLIAALLCYIVPKMIKTDAPLELVNNRLTMIYGGDGYYFLDGELKNVSDETITITNIGGMEVSFNNTDIKFDDCWLLKPDLPDNADLEDRSNYLDVVLAPGETYDFNNSTNCLNGKTSVTRLLVSYNGVKYNLYRDTSITNVLIVVFVIFALIFLILAVTQDKNQRNIALRHKAVLDMCAQSGEQSYILNGTLNDKNESKKAAAKTAGWALGAALSTIFIGGGVYRVYSGKAAAEFVLNEHSLFTVNASSPQSAPTLTPITRNDFPVSAIETKKDKVIVRNTDGKQSITVFVDKKSPITAEQVSEYLNNIFTKPVPQPAAEVTENTESPDSDPFADLAPDKATDKETETHVADDTDGKTDEE